MWECGKLDGASKEKPISVVLRTGKRCLVGLRSGTYQAGVHLESHGAVQATRGNKWIKLDRPTKKTLANSGSLKSILQISQCPQMPEQDE